MKVYKSMWLYNFQVLVCLFAQFILIKSCSLLFLFFFFFFILFIPSLINFFLFFFSFFYFFFGILFSFLFLFLLLFLLLILILLLYHPLPLCFPTLYQCSSCILYVKNGFHRQMLNVVYRTLWTRRMLYISYIVKMLRICMKEYEKVMFKSKHPICTVAFMTCKRHDLYMSVTPSSLYPYLPLSTSYTLINLTHDLLFFVLLSF